MQMALELYDGFNEATTRNSEATPRPLLNLQALWPWSRMAALAHEDSIEPFQSQ